MSLNYCMKCKRHVIALLYPYALAIVVEAIVGETTPMQRSRSRCRAGDDGYHDDALEMEIKKHKMMMAISCHIFLLHAMFILYASYFA